MADVFVPLNSFKSVLTTLTGEEDVVYTTPTGVSTIVLSAQITNVDNQIQPITIKMTSNRDLPVPQTGSVNHTGSFTSASALVRANETFLEKETAAYINFQNNLQEIPFEFTSSIYEGYVSDALDGVIRDLENGGTLGTQKADLLTIISSTIENPTRVTQKPIELIKNVEIPAGDSLSPIVAGKLVLEEEFSLIVSGAKDTTVILSILESANE